MAVSECVRVRRAELVLRAINNPSLASGFAGY
jgi:hypothetical protein